MADFTEKIILDDSEFVKALDNVVKQTNITEKEFAKSMENINKEFSKQGSDLEARHAKMEKQVTQAFTAIIERQNQAAKAAIEAAKQADRAAKAYVIFGVDVSKAGDSIGKALGVANNALKAFGLNLNTSKLKEYYNDLKTLGQVIASTAAVSITQRKAIIELSDATGVSRTRILAAAKAFNVFKVALLSTGIGVLLVALGALIAFFTRTGRGADFLSEKMAGIGAVVDAIIKVFGRLGGSIVESFQQGTVIQDFVGLLKSQVINRVTALIDLFGSLGKIIISAFKFDVDGIKKSLNEAGEAFIQFGTGIETDKIVEFANELNEARKAGEANKQALNQLRDAQRELNVETANSRAELNRLKFISQDQTKSINERKKALQQAFAIEQSQTAKREKLAQRELDLIRQKNKLASDDPLAKNNQEITDAEIRLAQIREQSFTRQRELQGQLNTLTNEQIRLITEAEKKFKDISGDLIELGRQFNLVSEQEEIEFIKEAEIQRLKEARAELIKIGQTLGKDVSGEVKIFDQLIEGAEQARQKIKEIPPIGEAILNDKTVKGIQKRFEVLNNLITLDINEQREKEKLEGQINRLTGNLQLTPPKIEIQIERPNLEPLTRAILDDLRQLADEVSKVIGNIGPPMLDAFHLIQGIITDTLKQQIDATQQLLDERTKQRETLESELQKELDYQARGLANNVGNKQAEVDALLEEETKYQEELRVLKDKEAKAQKRIESIAQAEAFITTAVNLYKGFSFLGPAGIPLGLAAVGAFTAWFAKIKADARRDTRLFKGAERIGDHFGYAAKNGESDIPGRGQGFAVVSNRTGRRTGVTISGKEMILPEKYSMTNSEFFHNMKKGMYDGVDLVQAIDVFKHYNTNDNKQIITKTVMGKQGNSGTWMPFEDKKGRKGAVYMEIKSNRSHGDIIYYE